VESLERPWGFCTFRVDGDLGHLIDFFIAPEARGGASSRVLTEELLAVMRDRKVSHVMGTVDLQFPKATSRVSFWLRMGADIIKADKDLIHFMKRL
jgi:hypothetical protein